MRKVRIRAKREIFFNVETEISEEEFKKIKSLQYDNVHFNDRDKFLVLEDNLDGEGIESSFLFEDVRVTEIQ
ncbi:hypothetical protein [uncultured Tenacibaculum sp.]|uniref:hypothetical protein n=1 Tax=uncultured Tenacibaculum sp. TaxID=174713 RepID=UPI002614BBED|nr:hypothetical protein [uncultured Tenacibaculum sp.]